jgi:hypothetical protein
MIAADVEAYAAAYDRYVDLLIESGYDLDVVFSTQQGSDLAIETSHALTPAMVGYLTGDCRLSLGPGS